MDGDRGAECKATKDARGSGGVNLRETCNWPTPQAHDAAPGDAKRVGRFGTKHGGRNLNDEACMVAAAGPPAPASPSTNGSRRDWSTPDAGMSRGVASPQYQQQRNKRAHGAPAIINEDVARVEGRTGSLNPRWVATLMGLPPDWLDGVSPDGDDAP
jgi:hypothetical protein